MFLLLAGATWAFLLTLIFFRYPKLIILISEPKLVDKGNLLLWSGVFSFLALSWLGLTLIYVFEKVKRADLIEFKRSVIISSGVALLSGLLGAYVYQAQLLRKLFTNIAPFIIISSLAGISILFLVSLIRIYAEKEDCDKWQAFSIFILQCLATIYLMPKF